MSNKNTLYVIIGVVLLLLIGVGAYMYLDGRDDAGDSPDTTNSQQEDSNADDSEEPPVIGTPEQTSDKGVDIVLSSPVRGSSVTSPLKIEGSVPGSWSHEGQFTVRLLDAESTLLTEGAATLSGDWMTESMVPFTATLNFDAPASGSAGLLVLEKANPSGLEDNADSLSVFVTFE